MTPVLSGAEVLSKSDRGDGSVTAEPRADPSTYRPDIDGLRAVAVSAVVLFHAGYTGVAGGFTGVDIFFVISGYLIGGHIFAEMSAGTFTFANFYTRRVRRILPALFAMLMACFLAGALVMTPEEYRELGKEAVASVYAVSNLLFYSGGGYFAPAADLKPLLMTWSLAVEEQFYIIFPFVMMVLLRVRRRRALAILLILSLLSFAGSLVLLERDATAAFYLLPTRAWELAVGAALALHEKRLHGKPMTVAVTEGLAAVGAALLVAGIFCYVPATPFPGWFVLLPTLGAAALLATRGSVVNRWLLAPRPMQFLGRVSYSFYLWHWPVFYFNRILGGEGTSPVFLIALALGLGILSWRFVEQPLRRRVLSERAVLVRYFGVALAVAGIGAGIYLLGGLPQRLSAQARAFAAEARVAKSNPCLAPYGTATLRNLDVCMLPAAPDQARVVVIGDSHGSSIAPGVAARSRQAGLAFGQLTKSSCPALNGYSTDPSDRRGHRAECLAFQRAAFTYVASHPEVATVVLASFWSSDFALKDAQERPVALQPALEATIGWLRARGKRVVLVQDAPTLRFDPYARVIGDLIPVRRMFGGGEGGNSIAPLAQVIPDAARPLIAAAGRATGTAVIDPHASLCTPAGCAYRNAGHLYYFDFQHLTAAGAERGFASGWRPDRESNPGARICSPLRHHSAIGPTGRASCKAQALVSTASRSLADAPARDIGR